MTRAIVFLIVFFSLDAGAASTYAEQTVEMISRADQRYDRAPLIVLVPKYAGACEDLARDIASAAAKRTEVFSEDVSHVRQDEDEWEIFSSATALVPEKTKFEKFLASNPQGGVVVFPASAHGGNGRVVRRVARLHQDGVHRSAAGAFKVGRHAFVIESQLNTRLRDGMIVADLIAHAVWKPEVGDCQINYIDGSRAKRVLEQSATVKTAEVASPRTSTREFVEDIVTRIGRANHPMSRPPLVLLTGSSVAACTNVARLIEAVTKDNHMHVYAYTSHGTPLDKMNSFLDFTKQADRGLVLVHKGESPTFNSQALAEVAGLIANPWINTPSDARHVPNYAYVVNATLSHHIVYRMSVESLLPRAHATFVHEGCEVSFFPGFALKALLESHACDVALGKK